MNSIINSKLLRWTFRSMFAINLFLIFYLTFQSEESTTLVSEHVRDIAAQTVSASSEDVSSSWWYNLRNFRQLAHLPEYFALGCTGYLTFMTTHIDKHRYLYTWLCCFAISCADQIIKYLLPTREFSFSDMAFDFIGYSAGALSIFCLFHILKIKALK